MRNRFKTSRICSSDNYELSKKLSKQQVFITVKQELKIVSRKYYVKCFGKLIEISREEAIHIYKSVNIIVK